RNAASRRSCASRWGITTRLRRQIKKTQTPMLKQLIRKREFGIFMLLLVLCITVAILNPRFLLPQNLQNNGRLIGIYGIFAIGIGLVIITGGIDLSIGSLMALLGVLLSMALTEQRWPWPL